MITAGDRDAIRAVAADIRAEVGRDASMINPADVAATLGLTFDDHPGCRSILWEGAPVAGVMMRAENKVMVAGEIRSDWKRLTALHLIGMPLFSDAETHVDLAITGGERVTSGRPEHELLADLLAVEIASPVDLVEAQFLHRFGSAVHGDVDMNELAANLRMNLADGITAEELATCGWIRRAMLFSSAIGYGSRLFTPLHTVFGLSPTAMGVRLQELGLVS